MTKWLKVLALWEAFWWLRRGSMRTKMFAAARARADELGRALVVIGAPDGGMTGGYPCGDVTIDMAPSRCPGAIQADITKPLPFLDDSVVVVVMCVLEYVGGGDSELAAAIAELNRISGGNLFVVRVEPWTLTAFLYPGTVRSISCEGEACSSRSIVRR